MKYLWIHLMLNHRSNHRFNLMNERNSCSWYIFLVVKNVQIFERISIKYIIWTQPMAMLIYMINIICVRVPSSIFKWKITSKHVRYDMCILTNFILHYTVYHVNIVCALYTCYTLHIHIIEHVANLRNENDMKITVLCIIYM